MEHWRMHLPELETAYPMLAVDSYSLNLLILILLVHCKFVLSVLEDEKGIQIPLLGEE